RFDHQTIAIALHDRFVAGELELDGNADRLIAAVTEQSDVPLVEHRRARAYASNIGPTAAVCKGYRTRRQLHPAIPHRPDWRAGPARAEAAGVPAAAIELRIAPAVGPFGAGDVGA